MSNYDWDLLFAICNRRKELARAFYELAQEDVKNLNYMDVIFDSYYSGLIDTHQVYKYLYNNLLRGTEKEKILIAKGVIQL